LSERKEDNSIFTRREKNTGKKNGAGEETQQFQFSHVKKNGMRGRKTILTVTCQEKKHWREKRRQFQFSHVGKNGVRGKKTI
jgi:hypothetical protein